MDERPPICFFGICNVRTWAIFAAIFEFVVSVLLLVVTLIYTIYVIVMAILRTMDSLYYIHLIILIAIAIILAIDIRLKMEIFEHKFTQTQLWMRVYVTVFMFTMFILVINVLGFFIYRDNIIENIQKIWILTLIACVIFGLILVPYYYPVHQYYKYEKIKREYSMAEHRSMYLDDTELEDVYL